MPTGDITTMDQLREIEAWIAQRIGAESVKFNTLDAFVSALMMPREDVCLRCFDGKDPLAG